MQHDTPGAGRTGFPLRRLASDFRYAFAFNIFCALVVTFMLDGGRNFWANMVASMCIGSIAFLLIDGVRLALWGEQQRPKRLPFLMLIVVSVPVAQSAGLALFGWLTGIKVAGFGSFDSPAMIGTWLFTLAATGGSTLFFINREKISRLEAAAAEERARAELVARQALQAQLQLLQAQIEPHMLFNTLANLQGLIGFDPQRAQLLLDQLIQYLRATLLSSRAQTTTLGQEFGLMEAYLGLMSVRMGARLSYAIDLPHDLRALEVPPMLLQPLVENAIQHGLEPHIDGGHIDVSAARDGASLLLTVRDNGLGLHQISPARNGTHVGLANIRERLGALYGAHARFSLDDGVPAGAVARLTLPLEKP